MKLRLDQMTSTPQGLVMGVQIRGPKDSWIRFAVLEVPWESVPRYVVDDWWRWKDAQTGEDWADLPLPFDLA
jgi:hypothetical protein